MAIDAEQFSKLAKWIISKKECLVRNYSQSTFLPYRMRPRCGVEVRSFDVSSAVRSSRFPDPAVPLLRGVSGGTVEEDSDLQFRNKVYGWQRRKLHGAMERSSFRRGRDPLHRLKQRTNWRMEVVVFFGGKFYYVLLNLFWNR